MTKKVVNVRIAGMDYASCVVDIEKRIKELGGGATMVFLDV